MPTVKQSHDEVTDNLVQHLYWHTAQRDDAAVVKVLAFERKADVVYALEDGGLLDEFFCFLEEIGVLPLVEKLHGHSIKRVMVPFTQFVMLYMLKTLYGIKRMNALPELLFSDEGAMRFVGFNAHAVREGVCRRGEHARKRLKRPGPICPQALSQNIVKLTPHGMEKFFNGAIAAIAAAGILPEKLSISIDTTKDETTEKYDGAGMTSRRRKHKDEDGQIRYEILHYYGWKIGAAFAIGLGIPVALMIRKIEVSDVEFTRELLEQAEQNIGEHSKIVSVVLDRGFLDGEDLWWIHSQGKCFVIPARSDMQIYDEAHRLARIAVADPKRSGNAVVKERVRTVTRGYGKHARKEHLRTVLVGLKDVKMYDDYGPPGHGEKKNRKDFEANPLGAVVVLEYEGNKYVKRRGPVFITNTSVENPFVPFDKYDLRSIMENSLWREGKQKLHLEYPPQRNERAVIVHSYFVMAIHALAKVFRKWKQSQDDAEENGLMTGIERFRRKLAVATRNKVIVFYKNKYGIIWISELLTLAGIDLKERDPGVGARDEILAKYGIPTD